MPLLVQPLISQLNKRLENDRTRAVPVIVGILRWLQNAAERAGHLAVPEDFHSKGVANMSMETLYDGAYIIIACLVSFELLLLSIDSLPIDSLGLYFLLFPVRFGTVQNGEQTRTIRQFLHLRQFLLDVYWNETKSSTSRKPNQNGSSRSRRSPI